MNLDLVQMFGHISQSLLPVQRLISGFAYLMGLTFFVLALIKFRKIGESAGGRGSGEKMGVAISYLLVGSVLLFFPATLTMVRNTLFGSTNPLQYTSYQTFNIKNSMPILIQTAGMLWFVRGCALLIGSSRPGEKHAEKGMVFLLAGILAMNFEFSVKSLDYLISHLEKLTLHVKHTMGY